MSRERLWLACLVAPLTTSPVLTVVAALHAARDKPWREVLATLDDPFFFFSFFGLSLAYLTEMALVGIAMAIGLQPATLPRRWIIALGVPAGAAVFGGLFHGPTWADTLWMAGVGALMGAVASGTFALVRGRADRLSWAV